MTNDTRHSPLPLSRPDITDLERQYVREVLSSSQLALGPWTKRFEKMMSTLCGVKHVVAVSSGTAALHLIVRGLEIGQGDEVVTTPFSFVASSNCILFENATPRFVDIDPVSLALNPEHAGEACNSKTKAILAVDVFGEPANWPELETLAEKHHVALIDDACEALGSSLSGRPLGSWANASAFGFYPNKQITTGEGGCITTDDHRLAELCRSMANQGRADAGRMEHVRLGFNYRLDEMSAALGCAQLERLPDLLKRRSRVANQYLKQLNDLQEDIYLPQEAENVSQSWFVYVIRLQPHFEADARDMALKLLREQAIGCAAYFPSIHLQPYYKERFGFKAGDFPICESVSERSLAIPFFPALKPEDIDRVARALRSILPQLPRKVKNYFS